MLVNTLSTAGRHVRPPQKPIPALVLNFNSRAEQLYFFAASSNSFKLTSTQRQMVTSFICILLGLRINWIIIVLYHKISDNIIYYDNKLYDVLHKYGME